MTLETQKTSIGRTRAIAMADFESERWISWLRLSMISVYALLSLYAFALGRTTPLIFSLQIFVALVVSIYSGLMLSRTSRRLIEGYSVFGLVTMDVTTVSAIMWLHYQATLDAQIVTGALFSAYFAAISFTALHHQVRLSIFAGLLSAAEYTLIRFFSFPVEQRLDLDYLLAVILLLTVALISGLISRNNYNSMQKIVSSRVRYHKLVHRLPQMLFTLDRDGRFLWTNMAAYRILGIPAKAMVGRYLKDFLTDMENYTPGKTTTGQTIQVSDFSGHSKYVDFILQASDDTDSDASWEGSMTDVTDRELAISQREEMIGRLFQYQKMESLGTLASGMAHDFNNILQTLQDISERVSMSTEEEETRKHMETIADTLTDAKFLVSELLALGRKKPLNYSTINLVSFLQKVVPRYAEQLGERYEVRLDLSEDILLVQGDSEYLKRVFQNLFGNARDAMPGGGKITVECFALRRTGEASNVIIRVSDMGTGIPRGLTEKVFDPFFTTKKPGKGTGLGLALVRRIVSLHNGQVTIEKTDESGTTFRIEIPESEQSGTDSDTTAVLSERQPATLLLLDDDPKIRDILRFFLADLNYAVSEAASKDEAVRALRKHGADCRVVIMDWKLGEEDPEDVIQSLRRIRKGLIVIVVSGYAPDEAAITELDIFRWFTKPYDKNRLDLEIQKALRRFNEDGTVNG